VGRRTTLSTSGRWQDRFSNEFRKRPALCGAVSVSRADRPVAGCHPHNRICCRTIPPAARNA